MSEQVADPSPRSWHHWVTRVSTLAVCCSVIFIFSQRWNGQQIRAPLQWDEILSLENYTWLAFTADGDAKQNRRADDLLHQARPSKSQLAFGMYRAFSVWREPNDHIPHSLLLNVAMLLPPSDERISRLPTFLGAIVFVITITIVARSLGLVCAWPVVMLLATAIPYIDEYSQMARGYSWMLAFQMLQLICLHQSIKRPDSILLATLSIGCGALTWLNIISLSVDWLFPLYLALWFYPPLPQHAEPSHRRAVRRNLFCQFAIISLLGLFFLFSHLPYIVLGQQAYGFSAPLAELPKRVAEILGYLFPTTSMQIVGCIGAVGFCGFTINRKTRPFGIICIAVIGISLIHFILTKKVPYARTCGYVLPLVLLGFGWSVEGVLTRLHKPAKAIGHAVVVFMLISLSLAGIKGKRSVDAAPETRLRDEIQQINTFEHPYVFVDHVDSYIVIRHLPPAMLTAQDDVDTFSAIDGLVLLGQKNTVHGTPAASWPQVSVADWKASSQRASAKRLLATTQPIAYPVILHWKPNPEKMGLRNQRFYEALGDERGLLFKHYRPRFMKLEFSMGIYAAEFLITNQEDFIRVRDQLYKPENPLGQIIWLIEPVS